jgi:hypothetical protein
MTTVYPLKFQLGPLEITGFGIMMMAAFLVGGWLIARQLREQKLNEDYAGDIVFGAVIVSIIGAKLWYVGLHGADSLFSRGGLVWYGGFLGGCLGVTLASLRRKVPVRFTAQLVAPVLPAAYAIGRVGCFMVGDDYGVASTVPWAVKFPQGIPPTTAAGPGTVRLSRPRRCESHRHSGRAPDAALRSGDHDRRLHAALALAEEGRLGNRRAVRALPGVRGPGAVRGGIPASQGRPVLRRDDARTGDQPGHRRDWRVLVHENEKPERGEPRRVSP